MAIEIKGKSGQLKAIKDGEKAFIKFGVDNFLFALIASNYLVLPLIAFITWR